jgi:hypothetical protein
VANKSVRKNLLKESPGYRAQDLLTGAQARPSTELRAPINGPTPLILLKLGKAA